MFRSQHGILLIDARVDDGEVVILYTSQPLGCREISKR